MFSSVARICGFNSICLLSLFFACRSLSFIPKIESKQTWAWSVPNGLTEGEKKSRLKIETPTNMDGKTNRNQNAFEKEKNE